MNPSHTAHRCQRMRALRFPRILPFLLRCLALSRHFFPHWGVADERARWQRGGRQQHPIYCIHAVHASLSPSVLWWLVAKWLAERKKRGTMSSACFRSALFMKEYGFLFTTRVLPGAFRGIVAFDISLNKYTFCCCFFFPRY